MDWKDTGGRQKRVATVVALDSDFEKGQKKTLATDANQVAANMQRVGRVEPVLVRDDAAETVRDETKGQDPVGQVERYAKSDAQDGECAYAAVAGADQPGAIQELVLIHVKTVAYDARRNVGDHRNLARAYDRAAGFAGGLPKVDEQQEAS